MNQNIDLEQVKQYNTALKQYRDKAAQLNAEIEYTTKEIDALCAELSTELGVSVTRDNIAQVYESEVAKINSTLQSGRAILAKIASEEANSQVQGAATIGVATDVAQPAPVQPAPVQPAPTVNTVSVQPVMGAPAQPLFNGQETELPVQNGNQPLPGFFNLG